MTDDTESIGRPNPAERADIDSGTNHTPTSPGRSVPLWRRRRRLAGIAVLTVAVATAATVVLIQRISNPDPAQVVSTYLHDLAAGDATGALSQGVPPATTTFLTRDILAWQQRHAALGHIRIAKETTTGDHATVTGSYTFGSRVTNDTFALDKSGGHWRMEDTFVPLQADALSANNSAATLFDRPLSGLGTIYVFPGPLQTALTNPDFVQTAAAPGSFTTTPGFGAAEDDYPPLAGLQLNATGRAAAVAALAGYYGACAKPTNAWPDHCPYELLTDSDNEQPGARWDAPRDYSGILFGDKALRNAFRPITADWIPYSGTAIWPMPGGERDSEITLMGSIDFSRNPPVVHPDNNDD